MEYTEEESARMVAEFKAKHDARPVKGTYAMATEGSKTERGGVVVNASTGIVIEGHRVARVGDTVRYPDGSESKIVSGAGFASVYKGQPVAIIGSATDNGDTIISSMQSGAKIREFADDDGIPGLLQAGYIPPETVAA